MQVWITALRDAHWFGTPFETRIYSIISRFLSGVLGSALICVPLAIAGLIGLFDGSMMFWATFAISFCFGFLLCNLVLGIVLELLSGLCSAL